MSMSGRMPLGVRSHRACCSSLNPSSGGQSAQANSPAALLNAPTKVVRCVFGNSARMRVGTFRGAGLHTGGHGSIWLRRGVLKCIAGDATVRLTVQQQLPFGESLRIAGSGDALGNWDPASAPSMTWGEEDRWTSEVALAPGTYDFKLVIVREDGSVAAWEPGEDRSVTVDEGSGPLEATCVWSDTASTSLSCSTEGSDEQAEGAFPATPGAAAQVEAAEAEAESQGAELTEVTPAPPAEPTPVNQASEAPEGADVIMHEDAPSTADLQKEGAPNAVEAVTHPEGETEASHPQLDSEAPTVPGAKEEWGVAGSGEMGSVTEVETEQQMQQDAPDQAAATSASTPGLAAPAPTHEDEEAESETETETSSEPEGELRVEAEQETSVEDALASPTAAAKFEEPPSESEVSEGKLDIAAEGQTVGQAAASPQPQAIFKTGEAAQQVTSVAESAAEPSTGVQGLLGLMGIVAVPVVGYSMYTLYKTGCGLPPGPAGLIGAVEGFSYVTLLGIAGWGIGMRATTNKGLPAGPGNTLGIAEGLSYLTLALGAVVLTLQVRNYGYIPSALPDSRCYGGSGPKSPSDVTKALSDVFSTSEAPQLSGRAAATSSSSSADSSAAPGSSIGNSFRPSPPYAADTAEALPDVARISAVAEARSGAAGTAATEAGPKGPAVMSKSPSLIQPRPSLAHMSSLYLDSNEWPAQQPSSDLAEASTSEQSAPQLTSDLAEVSASQFSAAPGDMELNRTAKKASRKLKELLEQDQYEEVYSGALDGLSGSDIAPVVEELENVVSSLVRLFTKTLPNLANSIFRPADSALVGSPLGSLGLAQGWLSVPLDKSVPDISQRSSDSTASSSAEEKLTVWIEGSQRSRAESTAVSISNAISSPGSSTASVRRWPQEIFQVAVRLDSCLVPADIGFTAAATNAVSAAVNVNNQVETMLGPLRQAAADMRSIVSRIADLAASIDKFESAAQVDRKSLARSAGALHDILGSATERVSASGSRLPDVIAQLQAAVAQLRSAEGTSAAPRADVAKFEPVVKTLEAAVAALSDASAALGVRGPLEAAKDTVQEEVRSEQVPSEPVAETAERAVDPAVQGIEKAVSRLQDALADLDSAVDTARGFRAEAAPPVKD